MLIYEPVAELKLRIQNIAPPFHDPYLAPALPQALEVLFLHISSVKMLWAQGYYWQRSSYAYFTTSIPCT